MSANQAETLIDYALELIATAEIEAPEDAEQANAALASWRAASSTHEHAYAQALERWTALRAMAPALKNEFTQPQKRRPEHRKTLAVLSILIIGAFSLAIGNWYLAQPLFTQSYQSGVGELLNVMLPDGSTLQLDAKTALRVDFYRHGREVELLSGRAWFDIASDKEKPFEIRTIAGSVRVVGTRFSVSQRDGLFQIAVEEGLVRFAPIRDSSAVELSGGRYLEIRDHGHPLVEARSVETLTAWREGWLVFDNTPLKDALPAINAYRSRPVDLATPALGDLRLTGRFSAKDPQALIEALPLILPLRVQEGSDRVRLIEQK